METKIAVTCELPGLEGVEVVYNMMASERQINEWQGAVGGVGKVILEVRNWPEELGEPFGEDAPMGFRLWAVQGGYQEAVKRFVRGPF